jgi:hypothetical protein
LNRAASDEVPCEGNGIAELRTLLGPAERIVVSVREERVAFAEDDGAQHSCVLSGDSQDGCLRGLAVTTRARWNGRILLVEARPQARGIGV